MVRISKNLVFLLVILVLPLGGCGWWQQTVGGKIQQYGHTKSYNPEVLPILYCYRTRGEPECYREPQKGQESRLITTQNPPRTGAPVTEAVNESPDSPSPSMDDPAAPGSEPDPTLSSSQVPSVSSPTPLSP
ncbi:MAG: hypothetical protein ORO03_02525 [Alphaproteobacteria bacterium]|nr:hypothetical protein [Alphaproteobacteria bacterium]